MSNNISYQIKECTSFFDEVQRVPDWEDAVNSFRVDFNCDIYAQAQMPICSPLNMPPIYLEDA